MSIKIIGGISVSGKVSVGLAPVSLILAGVNKTDDTFWMNRPGGQDMTWTGTQWENTDNNDDQDVDLSVITSGPNVGWQTSYRPTALNILLNSGEDGYALNDVEVKVYNAEDEVIGQTSDVEFTSWNSDIIVNVTLDYSSTPSSDISWIRVSSFIYDLAPYIKGIAFVE